MKMIWLIFKYTVHIYQISQINVSLFVTPNTRCTLDKVHRRACIETVYIIVFVDKLLPAFRRVTKVIPLNFDKYNAQFTLFQ